MKPTRKPWGDRVIVWVLMFGMGFMTADLSYRRQLMSLDQQVGAVMTALNTAHAQIDQLEGCTLKAAPIVSAALEAEHE